MKKILLSAFTLTTILYSSQVNLYNSKNQEMGFIEKIPKKEYRNIVSNYDKNESFIKAIDKSIEYFSVTNASFNYGKTKYTSKELLKSTKLFKDIYFKSLSYDSFIKQLELKFDIYITKNQNNKSLITGYYAPVLDGSLVKTKEYNIPIYSIPKDLVIVDLGDFKKELDGKKVVGRVENNKLIPYYGRNDIENGILADERPLLYLKDKIDHYFLQVQGSGIVRIEGGSMLNVGYAGANGREYISVGKEMLKDGMLKKDNATMQGIREYLRKNRDKVDIILNKNPSYVFFQFQDREPVGNINKELTPFVSIAMDSDLMPRGGIVYLKTLIPQKNEEKFNFFDINKSKRVKFENFMLTQDTGGAIKGGGRVDFYFGIGDEAEFFAGQMGEDGDIYLIVAKKEYLKE